MERKYVAVLALAALLLVVGTVHGFPIGGRGGLYAKGEGTALLQGSGTLIARGNGTIEVEDQGAPDLKVWVEGNGDVYEKGNVLIYHGTGTIKLKGRDLIIHIVTYKGAEVLAYGKGWVVLKGTGAFKTWKT